MRFLALDFFQKDLNARMRDLVHYLVACIRLFCLVFISSFENRLLKYSLSLKLVVVRLLDTWSLGSFQSTVF